MKGQSKRIEFHEVNYKNGTILLKFAGHIIAKNKQVKQILRERIEKLLDNYRLSHIAENSLPELCSPCEAARPNKIYCKNGINQLTKVEKCIYRYPAAKVATNAR